MAGSVAMQREPEPYGKIHANAAEQINQDCCLYISTAGLLVQINVQGQHLIDPMRVTRGRKHGLGM
jgi:hypothetical protein